MKLLSLEPAVAGMNSACTPKALTWLGQLYRPWKEGKGSEEGGLGILEERQGE